MKKILALAVGMLLVPFTAFAMQSISDAEMDSITGQSGVAIAIDDVKIYTHDGDSQMWYQTRASVDSVAAVGLVWSTDSYQMMHVNAIMATDANPANLYSRGRDLQGTYGDDSSGTYEQYFNYGNTGTDDVDFHSSALTIRVTDMLPIIGEAKANAGHTHTHAAGILIGLPTVEIFTEAGSSDIFEIKVSTYGNPLTGEATATSPNSTTNAGEWSFGTLYSSDGDSTMAILDGSLEISPLASYGQVTPAP